MLSYVNLSADSYLEIDLNTETVLRVRLDGDITTTLDDKKIEYTTDSGLRIIVNTDFLDRTFEINSYTIQFKVSYRDFTELPEVLASLMEQYMTGK